MRILLIAIFATFALTRCVYADEIKIDTTNWSQEEINMIQAMAVKMAKDNGVMYDKLYAKGETIIIENPSKDVSAILTSDNINQEYEGWKAASDEELTKARQEETNKKAELEANDIALLKLSDVDKEIDKAKDVNALKNIVKELVKYIKAKE